jgi:hypothetical protein
MDKVQQQTKQAWIKPELQEMLELETKSNAGPGADSSSMSS